MDENMDLVVFVDEDGNEKNMEVLDYFFYEGQEYAVLTEYDEAEGEHVHTEDCDHHHDIDAFIMKVVPVEDDQEEFLAIEDEALMDKLIEFVQNDLYGDEEEVGDDEFEEEEEEEDEE